MNNMLNYANYSLVTYIKMVSTIIFCATIISGCALKAAVISNGENFVCHGEASQWRFDDRGFGDNASRRRCIELINNTCAENHGSYPVILSENNINRGFAQGSVADILFHCKTEQELLAESKARIEKDKGICEENFGFKRNTPEMSNCLLELAKDRSENKRAEAANAEMQKLGNKIIESNKLQPQLPTVSVPQHITCHTYGNTTTCD